MATSSNPVSLSAVRQRAEEIYLLKCSLLPGERLLFLNHCDDAGAWDAFLKRYPDNLQEDDVDDVPRSPPCIRLVADDARLWIEVQYPNLSSPSNLPTVNVKGDDITRIEQERWQLLIQECARDVEGSEFPTYEVISTHLLPLLHVEAARPCATEPAQHQDMVTLDHQTEGSARYHALLTSHHLISPTKRKNLQQWSSQLHITGFAKVGYPGIIYCEGWRDQVEEFVANIKAMQWLALRVRFAEPLPSDLTSRENEKRVWMEFDKVGAVVEEMRRLGRELFVVEMGIGSAGQK